MFFHWGKRPLQTVALTAVLLLVMALAACGQPLAAVEPVAGIAFVSERDGNEEIYLIQANGYGLIRLTQDPQSDNAPAWSPDGRQIAFQSRRDGSFDIFIMGADGSRPVNLVGDPQTSFLDDFHPVWSPDGQTLAIYTDRFNLDCVGHVLALMPVSGGKDNITLAPVPPANQISFAWSPDGRAIVYSACSCNSDRTYLMRWDRQAGQVTRLTEDALSPSLYPAWSHDGRFVAFASSASGNYEIYRLELASGTVVNLTDHPARDEHPTWSPDGSQIAFVSNRDGNEEVYVMDADGSNPRNLSDNPARDFAPAWSPVP